MRFLNGTLRAGEIQAISRVDERGTLIPTSFAAATSPSHRVARVLKNIAFAALLLASSACVGPPIPVRVSPKTKDISGTDRELNFTFLKAGATTRQQVEKSLAPIDTGTKEPPFFWGRWESSNWASAPLLAPYPPLSGRNWAPQSILITFDQHNVVQDWKILKDKELFLELDCLEHGPAAPLDLSAPVRLDVQLSNDGPDARFLDLVLSPASLEFEAYHEGFKMDRHNLVRITFAPEGTFTDPPLHHKPDPAHVWITLHFAKRTAVGKSLTCGIDPSGFLLLRRYLREAGSPTALRETMQESQKGVKDGSKR